LLLTAPPIPAEEYKPKLEKILNSIIIISEVAELAEEADHLPDEVHGATKIKATKTVERNVKRKSALTEARWQSVRFNEDNPSSSDMPGDSRLIPDRLESLEDIKDDTTAQRAHGSLPAPIVRMLSRDASGSLRIKNLLDQWEEPVNKADRVSWICIRFFVAVMPGHQISAFSGPFAK
jgi:hypothetical protein